MFTFYSENVLNGYSSQARGLPATEKLHGQHILSTSRKIA